ncbi:hypothetical protein D3C71_1857450 [compost metagenome]
MLGSRRDSPSACMRPLAGTFFDYFAFSVRWRRHRNKREAWNLSRKNVIEVSCAGEPVVRHAADIVSEQNVTRLLSAGENFFID